MHSKLRVFSGLNSSFTELSQHSRITVRLCSDTAHPSGLNYSSSPVTFSRKVSLIYKTFLFHFQITNLVKETVQNNLHDRSQRSPKFGIGSIETNSFKVADLSISIFAE